jgi:hypothetical protein
MVVTVPRDAREDDAVSTDGGGPAGTASMAGTAGMTDDEKGEVRG